MSWCVKQKGPVFTSTFSPFIQIFAIVLDVSILHEQIHLGRWYLFRGKMEKQ
nr:WAT1-related protein At3g30340-like [Ipomoea batatas]